jgi:hypothetical protein
MPKPTGLSYATFERFTFLKGSDSRSAIFSIEFIRPKYSLERLISIGAFRAK